MPVLIVGWSGKQLAICCWIFLNNSKYLIYFRLVPQWTCFIGFCRWPQTRNGVAEKIQFTFGSGEILPRSPRYSSVNLTPLEWTFLCGLHLHYPITKLGRLINTFWTSPSSSAWSAIKMLADIEWKPIKKKKNRVHYDGGRQQTRSWIWLQFDLWGCGGGRNIAAKGCALFTGKGLTPTWPPP